MIHIHIRETTAHNVMQIKMQMTVFHASTEIFYSPRQSHYAVSEVLTFWPRNTIPNTVQEHTLILYGRKEYVNNNLFLKS